MPLLFSYGSLQQERVQLQTFGRRMDGSPDRLPGFEKTLVKIDDPARAAAMNATHYSNVTFTGRRDCFVDGTALEATEAELAMADAYERLDGYARVEVTLASGRAAWLYVDARGGRSH